MAGGDAVDLSATGRSLGVADARAYDQPMPTDIDRFGSWLKGWSDGAEGIGVSDGTSADYEHGLAEARDTRPSAVGSEHATRLDAYGQGWVDGASARMVD